MKTPCTVLVHPLDGVRTRVVSIVEDRTIGDRIYDTLLDLSHDIGYAVRDFPEYQIIVQHVKKRTP